MIKWLKFRLHVYFTTVFRGHFRILRCGEHFVNKINTAHAYRSLFESTHDTILRIKQFFISMLQFDRSEEVISGTDSKQCSTGDRLHTVEQLEQSPNYGLQ